METYKTSFELLSHTLALVVSLIVLSIGAVAHDVGTSSIFVPLFSALVLSLASGRFPIKFIDALFVCISSATGTGLSSLDLSSLTAFQQSIVFALEFMGNQVCGPTCEQDDVLRPPLYPRPLFRG